jgi:hypothetical protein
MRYEAFICCYFDQEDRDRVGVHIVFTLFWADFSNAMGFCGELLQNSLWEDGKAVPVVKRLK